ncbi:MAG TPA: hypothetical protein VFY15_05775 [Acidimicrobiia bacterium]|nr:hypothetical protein [Acidimicrobiia bacterium]
MRGRVLIALLSLLIVACGDDDTGTGSVVTTTTAVAATTSTAADTTTTTAAPTTTTTLGYTDPRFPDTNMSARFGGRDGDPIEFELDFDPAGILALFYRTADHALVVVMTGFDVATPVVECGWGIIDYGPASVIEADSWFEAVFGSYANQPWATAGATAESRCEEQFLEDGSLRPDIVTATQCDDYVVVVFDQMNLDATAFDAEVAVPEMHLIVDSPDGSVRLEAIPWLAHPGANPTAADMLEVEPATLGCTA